MQFIYILVLALSIQFNNSLSFENENSTNHSCYKCMDYGCSNPFDSSYALVFNVSNCTTGCFVIMKYDSFFFIIK